MTDYHGQSSAGKRTYFRCTVHHKLAYPKRQEARAAARALHDSGLREYHCTAHRGCWHIGHMPPCVKRGTMTAAEFYDLPKRKRARMWAETTEEPDPRLRQERDR
jgi:hypothetical protein